MRIANWEKFQGYRKSGPEWLKLYTGLIDKPEWIELPMVAKAVLYPLWIAAARNGSKGELPDSVRLLSMICHMSETEVSEALPSLIHSGFVFCDKPVADSATKLSQGLRQNSREVGDKTLGREEKRREEERREEPPPVRVREAEDADTSAECQQAADDLMAALERATQITGRTGAEILADSTVRGKGSVIIDPRTCRPAALKLWKVTTERVAGYVAAWEADRRKAAPKRGGAPSWDRGPVEDDPEQAMWSEASRWVSESWPECADFASRADLEAALKIGKCPETIRGTVLSLLLASRYPNIGRKTEAA